MDNVTHNVLPNVHEVDVYSTFHSILPHIQLLWELVLCSEVKLFSLHAVLLDYDILFHIIVIIYKFICYLFANHVGVYVHIIV